VPRGEVLEPKERVPVSGAAATGIVLDNLEEKEKDEILVCVGRSILVSWNI
jgi:hypothetical protein